MGGGGSQQNCVGRRENTAWGKGGGGGVRERAQFSSGEPIDRREVKSNWNCKYMHVISRHEGGCL